MTQDLALGMFLGVGFFILGMLLGSGPMFQRAAGCCDCCTEGDEE